MQKFTGKEIIVRKSEVKSLLADALCFHDLCDSFRPIPNGDWMTWVEFNFCKPRGITDRMARNYMRIANENSKLVSRINWKRVSKGEVDYELVTQLKFDTIRKYSISFIEEKEQPEHADNIKFPRLASF
jgi:hypothetical protein